jgi:hypothetical protein
MARLVLAAARRPTINSIWTDLVFVAVQRLRHRNAFVIHTSIYIW